MSRNEYVQKLLEQVPAEARSDIEAAVDQWWWDSKPDNWRLTWYGYACLHDLQTESWEFDFPTREVKPWIYLALCRNLTVPYYIVDNKKHNRLVVFDSRSAVMIRLYGDLIKWIRAIASK
jgi:hypothetical protein